MIRDRYATALRMGHPPIEAAKLAQSNAPIKPHGKVARAATVSAPAKPQPLKVESKPPVSTVQISGAGEEKSVPVPEAKPEPQLPAAAVAYDIPPNWDDLPWPQLRELASQISGERVRSRADASQIIEEALRSSSQQ